MLTIFAIPKRKNGVIAQLVEQRTENPCVPGSIPGDTTKDKTLKIRLLISLQTVKVQHKTLKKSDVLHFCSSPGLLFPARCYLSRTCIWSGKRDFVAVFRHLEPPRRGGAFIQAAIELRSWPFSVYNVLMSKLIAIINRNRRIQRMQRPE